MATAGLGKLVRPATFSNDAVLAIDCSTREEFEARLSDFADALDRIQVDASLLTDEQTKLNSSLNRFSGFFSTQDGVDSVAIANAARTLQRNCGLRHTHQQIGSAANRPRILRELGISDPGLTHLETLNRVRSRSVSALLTMRTENRRAVDIKRTESIFSQLLAESSTASVTRTKREWILVQGIVWPRIRASTDCEQAPGFARHRKAWTAA